MALKMFTVTEDGFEKHLGVNHLGEILHVYHYSATSDYTYMYVFYYLTILVYCKLNQTKKLSMIPFLS